MYSSSGIRVVMSAREGVVISDHGTEKSDPAIKEGRISEIVIRILVAESSVCPCTRSERLIVLKTLL